MENNSFSIESCLIELEESIETKRLICMSIRDLRYAIKDTLKNNKEEKT